MLSDVLHIGVLCSKRAPGLRALLHHPFRRQLYEIDCVISSDAAFADSDVPVISHPIRSFYDERRAPLRDLKVRAEFDGATVSMLKALGVDTVVLLGYVYIVTNRLLDAFPGRVLNVHDGLATYPGLHATRDAILAGEPATYSIVHVVTPELDAGPQLARSAPLAVAPFVRDAVLCGSEDIARVYAYAHREWMMRSIWGDLLVRAIEEVAVREEAVV